MHRQQQYLPGTRSVWVALLQCSLVALLMAHAELHIHNLIWHQVKQIQAPKPGHRGDALPRGPSLCERLSTWLQDSNIRERIGGDLVFLKWLSRCLLTIGGRSIGHLYSYLDRHEPIMNELTVSTGDQVSVSSLCLAAWQVRPATVARTQCILKTELQSIQVRLHVHSGFKWSHQLCYCQKSLPLECATELLADISIRSCSTQAVNV